MLTLQQLVNFLLVLLNILMFHDDKVTCAEVPTNSKSKPHIILIVADDMVSDLSFSMQRKKNFFLVIHTKGK